MKEGDKIYVVRDVDGNPLSSPNTLLVAALVTLGIPLDEHAGVMETREMVAGRERRTVSWVLKNRSMCGRYKTGEMIRCFDDRAWLEANPDHPLTYIKKAQENHARMVDHIKSQVPLAMVRRGKKIALIPMDATPELKAKLMNMLER